jgi:uncharacterized protein YkwD
MFRKFWRTIKVFVIVIAALLCLPRSILPKQAYASEIQELDNYIKLNDSETRLIEFKDDVDALRLKLTQIDYINNSRKKFKAKPVKLDILASRVANKMCKEAAENDFIGHWNLAGEKPYHRYSSAGGADHIAENAFGEWTTGSYSVSPSTISSMMKKGHSAFMAEKAPADGHKKTIIDKYHNFAGIGYYLSSTQFRYYEEFVDRYLEFENVPSEIKVDEPFTITVRPLSTSYLYYLIVYREKSLKPMNSAQIKRMGSYSDFADEEYMKLTAWELSQFRSGNSYNIPLKFTKEGLYYIHIYLDGKEITKPGTLNTKGKTSASGIVITSKN